MSNDPLSRPHWSAKLALGFDHDGVRTRMQRLAQHGPLTIQKALYPEGLECCHAVVLHPPAGMVEGDSLALSLGLRSAAQALVTTPGAGKWYAGRTVASLRVTATLDDHARLEYVPQENIAFSGAQVHIETGLDLSAQASTVILDVTALGRPSIDEKFVAGVWQQRTMLRRTGQVLWWEQVRLAGGDPRLQSRSGLAGASAFGTLLMAATGLTSLHLTAARGVVQGCCRGAVTLLPGVLVARALGNGTEAVRHYLVNVWQSLRPLVMGRPAVLPRIWRT
jgi:urease accessory protein